MNEKDRKLSPEEVVKKIRKLDQKDLVLVNNGVQLLLARQELEKKEEAPA